jgi:hypothetical protein
MDDDFDAMQRLGDATQSGLVFVLNNRATWNGTWIQTQWNNTRLCWRHGAAAKTSVCHKKNGLTSPAGLISGLLRVATQCTYRSRRRPRRARLRQCCGELRRRVRSPQRALNYCSVRECISRPNSG